MTEINEPTIQRACHGDPRAFAEVYNAFVALVFSVAFRISNVREDAEEITQEVFVNLFRKFSQFSFLSSLKTWIYRIAVNTALNARRTNVREAAKRVLAQQSLLLAQAPPQPDEIIQSEVEVQELLSRLPVEQRVCIVLRNIEGLSYQEIAETLQINLNTVRSRLKRAREALLAWKQGGEK
ncbi:hypothetical protein AUK22_07360 [bacterium CG2_30_54_10]|nr:MAG: hypothetical protein AUK22_07360 [bacterium CG2_30_54_10]